MADDLAQVAMEVSTTVRDLGDINRLAQEVKDVETRFQNIQDKAGKMTEPLNISSGVALK